MEKESEMVELKEKIDELESLKSELTSEKEALDARIRDLEAAARQNEDKLSSQAAAKESQAERLVDEVKRAKKSAADSAEALRVVEAKLAESEESLDAERRKLESTTLKWEEVSAAKTAAEASLKKVADESSEALKICQASLAETQASLEEEMRKNETISRKLEEVAEANSVAEAGAREIAAVQDKELQRLRDALAEKSQRVDSLQSELTTLKQSMADREKLATAKATAAAALEDLKRTEKIKELSEAYAKLINADVRIMVRRGRDRLSA